MDSVSVPIWLTFSKRALQLLSSMAFLMRMGFVTVKSSLSRKSASQLYLNTAAESGTLPNNLEVTGLVKVAPSFPVILSKRILNADDRVLLGKLLIQVGQFLVGQPFAAIRLGVLPQIPTISKDTIVLSPGCDSP